MPATSRVLVWFVAGALVCGAADLLQAAAAIAGQPLGALTLVALTFHVGLALLAAGIYLLLRHAWPTTLGTGGALIATALLLPAAALTVAYVNFVHLPSIRSPLTLAVNAGAIVLTAALWLAAARSPRLARATRSLVVPLLLAALGLAGSAAAGAGWAKASASEVGVSADDLPNVFVIAIDSLRADRVGTGKLTPTFESLAARGLSFRHAYTQASWTKPAVASLLTSLYPSSHGANLRRARLSADAPTAAELFAALGYRTATFSANPWISPAFGFDRGVAHFFETERETFARLVLLLRVLRAFDRPLESRPLSRAIASVERAGGLVRDHRSNCERDRAIALAFDSWLESAEIAPAFAYFHMMSPHIPYDPPGGRHDFDNDAQVALLQRTEPLTPERRKELLRLYDEAVEHADATLGEIIAAIERRGLLERSIIVVTADHGEEFFEHGRFGHGKSLYEEVSRVPLVIVGPGLSAASVTDVAAMHVDILPTLAAMIGAPHDERWAGTDLRKLVRGRVAFGELIREGGLETRMVSDGGRKLIESVDALGAAPHGAVYDLDADPGENRPLPVSDEAKLATELARLREVARGHALARENAILDESAEERLRALGYIN